MLQYLTSGDLAALMFIQETLRFKWLTPLMVGLSTLGNVGMIWIIIAIGLILTRRRDDRRCGILILLALAVTFIIVNRILKNMVGRVRPFAIDPAIVPLVSPPKDFSFPSGHTAGAFAAATVIALGMPKGWGIPALILAFAIGLSRIYLGVHFPSDVAMGAIIGSIIGGVVFRLGQRIRFRAMSHEVKRE